jgi:long-chain acyl-CoA synthetase
MFGQSMATFVPPMLGGVVVFMRGFSPGDIVAQVRTRRISVIVCVPKILDVLREHVLRVAPEAANPSPKRHWVRRWWHFRGIHRKFGLKFWAFVVAAPLDGALEAFWGELGFVGVLRAQLTETARSTLNHPFGTKKGSVGKVMAGVDVKIAEDGEILVRGENVTRGYFNAAEETARAFEDGWFHTGDVGEIGPGGELFIRGRKKEMIVTPEGLNVFPEDVEKVLNAVAGVVESAVVGVAAGGAERVHAVLVLVPGTDAEAVVRDANHQLADQQKIRRALVWPERELPRTEGPASSSARRSRSGRRAVRRRRSRPRPPIAWRRWWRSTRPAALISRPRPRSRSWG